MLRKTIRAVAVRLPYLLTAIFVGVFLGTSVAIGSTKDARHFDAREAGLELARGNAYRREATWEAATREYTRAISLNPGLAEAYYGRGIVGGNTGHPERAARDLRTAILLRSDYLEAYLARASVRVQLGDLDGALSDARSAIRVDPGKPASHLQLGSLYTLAGDELARKGAFERAAELYAAQGDEEIADDLRDGLRPRAVSEERPPPPAPQTADVIAARKLLASRYVDRPRFGFLLDKAWQGASGLARTCGVVVPASLAPLIDANESNSDRRVQTALDRLISLSEGRASGTDLIFEAISAMARSLNDNHTAFARPSASRSSSTGLVLSYGYVAVVIQPGRVLVREVRPGGPADRAGIRPGDIIRALGADPTGTAEAGGPGGMAFDVDRDGQFVRRVSIEPEPAAPHTLSTSLLDGHVGYVRLSRFPVPGEIQPDGRTFVEAFDDAMRSLREEGASRWLLDLRGNAGGILTSIAIVAGRFGYHGRVQELAASNGYVTVSAGLGRALAAHAPLAILVDQESLSAAEILAGALQDGGRARIFGVTTGGKVNAANTYPVAGGMLQITTARVRTGPTKVQLDKGGVRPDEIVPLSREELAAGRDNQLEAAVRYLRSLRGR